jgi:hypothetical protein
VEVIKSHLVKAGRRPRRILAGPYKGLAMNLDLNHQTQVLLGLYEAELTPWLRTFASDAATAIDVGAGHGEYSLYVLVHSKTARVMAFEPEAEARSAFSANLKLNAPDQPDRLVISERMVGATCDGGTTTLDSLAPVITGPCFVKIDVEGHEVEVLRGSSKLLAMKGVSWIIETHASGLEATCLSLLRDAGLETRVVSPAWWRAVIPEHRPLIHNRWIVASRHGITGRGSPC